MGSVSIAERFPAEQHAPTILSQLSKTLMPRLLLRADIGCYRLLFATNPLPTKPAAGQEAPEGCPPEAAGLF